MHIDKKDLHVTPGRVAGKVYPTNKARFWMSGPEGYEDAVVTALRDALIQAVHIDVGLLRKALVRQGVPAEAVEAYCLSAEVEDETFLRIGSLR